MTSPKARTRNEGAKSGTILIPIREKRGTHPHASMERDPGGKLELVTFFIFPVSVRFSSSLCVCASNNKKRLPLRAGTLG